MCVCVSYMISHSHICERGRTNKVSERKRGGICANERANERVIYEPLTRTHTNAKGGKIACMCVPNVCYIFFFFILIKTVRHLFSLSLFLSESALESELEGGAKRLEMKKKRKKNIFSWYDLAHHTTVQQQQHTHTHTHIFGVFSPPFVCELCMCEYDSLALSLSHSLAWRQCKSIKKNKK